MRRIALPVALVAVASFASASTAELQVVQPRRGRQRADGQQEDGCQDADHGGLFVSGRGSKAPSISRPAADRV